jgi:hypothetical protein
LAHHPMPGWPPVLFVSSVELVVNTPNPSHKKSYSLDLESRTQSLLKQNKMMVSMFLPLMMMLLSMSVQVRPAESTPGQLRSATTTLTCTFPTMNDCGRRLQGCIGCPGLATCPFTCRNGSNSTGDKMASSKSLTTTTTEEMSKKDCIAALDATVPRVHITSKKSGHAVLKIPPVNFFFLKGESEKPTREHHCQVVFFLLPYIVYRQVYTIQQGTVGISQSNKEYSTDTHTLYKTKQ